MKLRHYQTEAINATWRYWRSGGKSPLIVAPTGAGKSIIIAEIIRAIRNKNPAAEIMCLTHVAELVQQNRLQLQKWSPDTLHQTGIVSGKLGNQVDKPIIFGTVQTVVNRLEYFSNRNIALLILDEAHRIPREAHTQYGQVINGLKALNPQLRILGLTATPYRMDSGLLHDGDDAIFDGISYDIGLRTLIEGKHLVEPKTYWTTKIEQVDESNLKVQAGDFTANSQEQNLALTLPDIVAEVVSQLDGRGRVLWFCPSIALAEKTTEILHDLDEVSAICITSNTNASDRKDLITGFKAGIFCHLVNVDILTTGFDAPEVDAIVLLRATKSTNLFVQMCGRGLRTADYKEDCIIFDYGRNFERHGFLDDPEIGTQRRTTVKKCPKCGFHCRLTDPACSDCGYVFPEPEKKENTPKDYEFAPKHEGPIVSWDAPPMDLEVKGIEYNIHLSKTSKTGLPVLKVTYFLGGSSFHNEFLCPFHQYGKFPQIKFKERCEAMGLMAPYDLVAGDYESETKFLKWVEENFIMPETIEIGRKSGDHWNTLLKVNLPNNA